MTGLRVFRVHQQQGSTGRWGTLANGRAVSYEPVNTAWTWPSAGLATSEVSEERASRHHAGVSSGQVRWRRAAIMALVVSLGVLQGRHYSNPVIHERAHKSSSNITPELSTQRLESAQVKEACPRQLSHVLAHWQLLVDQHTILGQADLEAKILASTSTTWPRSC